MKNIYIRRERGRSSVGLERWPVTPEVAGSSPVGPAFFIIFPF